MNGLCEQWGSCTTQGSSTITLPIPYTGVDTYKAYMTNYQPNQGYASAITEQTSTSIKVTVNSSKANWWTLGY